MFELACSSLDYIDFFVSFVCWCVHILIIGVSCVDLMDIIRMVHAPYFDPLPSIGSLQGSLVCRGHSNPTAAIRYSGRSCPRAMVCLRLA